MKKILATALVLAACAGSLTVANAFVKQDRGYITVTSVEAKEVSPNIVTINFAIETTDKTLELASTENKKVADEVYMALRGLIDVENKDYVKTQNFNANPIYSYKNNKQVLDGYRVSNELVVKTNNIDLASNLIDMGLKKGANRVSNLNFQVENYDAQCADIMGISTKKAKDQAAVVAKSISKRIIGVKSLSTSCTTPGSYPQAYRTLSKSVMDSATGNSTPIEGGKMKIEATVEAQFYIK